MTGIYIYRTDNNISDACLDDLVRARGRASSGRTRLERYIQFCCFWNAPAKTVQALRLRVWPPRLSMMTPGDNAVAQNQDRANGGIGAR